MKYTIETDKSSNWGFFGIGISILLCIIGAIALMIASVYWCFQGNGYWAFGFFGAIFLVFVMVGLFDGGISGDPCNLDKHRLLGIMETLDFLEKEYGPTAVAAYLAKSANSIKKQDRDGVLTLEVTFATLDTLGDLSIEVSKELYDLVKSPSQNPTINCPKCKAKNPAQAKFCSECGTSLIEVPQPTSN